MTKFILVDVETTGLNPSESSMIQGAIKVVEIDRQGKIADLHSYSEVFWISPIQAEKGMTDFITNYTGISKEAVQNSKVTSGEFVKSLCDIKRIYPEAYVVAQYLPFDFSFIKEQSAFTSFLDLRFMSSVVYEGFNPSLEDTCKRLGVSTNGNHNALVDVNLMAEVLSDMSQRGVDFSTFKNDIGYYEGRTLRAFPHATRRIYNMGDGRSGLGKVLYEKM